MDRRINGIIDIGNTAVKWAVFEGNELLKSGKSSFGDWTAIQKLNKEFETVNWFVSSVHALPEVSELGFSFQTLETDGPLPVTIRYKTPSTLGRDRLAAVCGAHHLFPNTPSLVIDAGTCITFDVIDGAGNYFGGAISPGIFMRLKAMHQFTGKLPQLEWEDLDGFIGDSTKNSMLQGVKQGVLGEANHQIDRYTEKYPNLRVLVTGGDGPFFEKNLKKDIFAAPNLVLIGLNTIQNYKQSLNA